jgi:hypothetical protein
MAGTMKGSPPLDLTSLTSEEMIATMSVIPLLPAVMATFDPGFITDESLDFPNSVFIAKAMSGTTDPSNRCLIFTILGYNLSSNSIQFTPNRPHHSLPTSWIDSSD